MELVKAILRGFSYVYHAALAVCLIVVGGLALATAPQSLHLDMLPWTGTTLAWVIVLASLAGLAAIVLALRETLRPLFFLWTLAVTVLMVRGFFFSSYRFDPGSGGPRRAAYLIVGSLVALVGAFLQMMRQPAESGRRY